MVRATAVLLAFPDPSGATKMAAGILLAGYGIYQLNQVVIEIYNNMKEQERADLADKTGIIIKADGSLTDANGKTINVGGSQAAAGAPMPDPDDEDRFTKAYNNLSEKGKNNVNELRKWAKDNGFTKLENNGGPEVWGLEEADGSFSWRLKIKPEPSSRPGLLNGSNMPRFDARLDNKGTYTNPLTKEIGGRNIGTHIPLE